MELLLILGVVLAAIVAQIIGALWYSPALFGNMWMKAGGFDARELDAAKEGGMTVTYALQFVAWFITFFILAYAAGRFTDGSSGELIVIAFLVWIGFIMPIVLQATLWDYRVTKMFFVVNATHNLIALLGGAIVISFFL